MFVENLYFPIKKNIKITLKIIGWKRKEVDYEYKENIKSNQKFRPFGPYGRIKL